MGQSLFPPLPESPKDHDFSTRQAALLLHALPEADQVWLLGRLPTPKADVLKSLVDELKTLGIPSDLQMLEVLRPEHEGAARAASHEKAPAMDSDGFIRELNAVHPSLMVRVLAGEPPSVTLQLLDLHDWKWGNTVRSMLGVSGPDDGASKPSLARARARQQGRLSLFGVHLLKHFHTRYLAECARDHVSVNKTRVGGSGWIQWAWLPQINRIKQLWKSGMDHGGGI